MLALPLYYLILTNVSNLSARALAEEGPVLLLAWSRLLEVAFPRRHMIQNFGGVPEMKILTKSIVAILQDTPINLPFHPKR
jgi:hypothetical protein